MSLIIYTLTLTFLERLLYLVLRGDVRGCALQLLGLDKAAREVCRHKLKHLEHYIIPIAKPQKI